MFILLERCCLCFSRAVLEDVIQTRFTLNHPHRRPENSSNGPFNLSTMFDRHVIVIVTAYPPPPVSVITRDGVYYCDRYIIFCAVTYDITVLNENNTICNTSIGMMRDRRHVLYLYRVIPQTCIL